MRQNQNGLQTPKKIIAATAAYRDEQDMIGEWIGERCKTGPGCSAVKGDLYKDYCNTKLPRVFAQTRLTRRLTDLGHALTKDKRKVLGITLASHFIPS
jgi:phage/plasmid-associated DNA primase